MIFITVVLNIPGLSKDKGTYVMSHKAVHKPSCEEKQLKVKADSADTEAQTFLRFPQFPPLINRHLCLP